jgi:F5/8 type C domain.
MEFTGSDKRSVMVYIWTGRRNGTGCTSLSAKTGNSKRTEQWSCKRVQSRSKHRWFNMDNRFNRKLGRQSGLETGRVYRTGCCKICKTDRCSYLRFKCSECR